MWLRTIRWWRRIQTATKGTCDQLRVLENVTQNYLKIGRQTEEFSEILQKEKPE